MKKLYLMIHQIKKLIKTHKAFSILLVMAQLLGILILLFSAATIQSISAKQKEIDAYTLYFEVDMRRYLEETEERVIGYSGEGDQRNPVYEMKQKLDPDCGLPIGELTKRIKTVIAESPMDEQPNIMISGYYDRDNYNYRVVTFMDHAAGVGDGEVSLRNAFPEYSEGDSFQFGSKPLKITRIADNQAADLMVSINDLPEDWVGTEFRFTYQEAPTTKQAEEMKKLLVQNFDFTDMHIPETVDPLTAQFHSTAILCTLIMLIAVLLNICYAQLFRFRLARHSFAVFRLVGADLKAICSICYTEVFLVSAALYTSGVLLFHNLLRGSISAWYEGSDSLYTAKYYLIFGGAYLLFQLILISIPLKRFIGREVVAAEKEVD